MVPESAEVSTLYPLAQLQVDDTEDSHSVTVSGSTGSFFLRHAGIHREENIQCLIHVCHVLLWKIWNWPRGYLGDNCIHNFHLGRYIVGYTVGNLVLRRCMRSDFRTYIRRYTSPNQNFEYGYPHFNALLQFELKFERCKPYKAACHPTKCDVINDVKLFPTVYRRIYCRKFLTLSNQTLQYKLMCIRKNIFHAQLS